MDFDFIDCQVETDHLKRLGAQPWPRAMFLEKLHQSTQKSTRKGPWQLSLGPVEALEKIRAATRKHHR